jgi:hypothetical protein
VLPDLNDNSDGIKQCQLPPHQLKTHNFTLHFQLYRPTHIATSEDSAYKVVRHRPGETALRGNPDAEPSIIGFADRCNYAGFRTLFVATVMWIPYRPPARPSRCSYSCKRNITSGPADCLLRYQFYSPFLLKLPLSFRFPPCLLHIFDSLHPSFGLHLAERIKTIALRILERVLYPASTIRQRS